MNNLYWIDEDGWGACSHLCNDFMQIPAYEPWRGDLQDPSLINTSIHLVNHQFSGHSGIPYAPPPLGLSNDGAPESMDFVGIMAMPHPSSEPFIEEGTQTQLNHAYDAPGSKGTGESEQDHNEASTQKIFICKQCGATETSLPLHRLHVATHGHICNECHASFTDHWHLSLHALKTSHQAYRCTECDSTFSRLDVLGRHKQGHQPAAKIYSCDHCKKWRAPNGFKRKDHLTQHIRNYHHIQISVNSSPHDFSYSSEGDSPGFRKHCLHESCSLFLATWDWNTPPLFPTRSAFTAHMKNEHDESIFPCNQPGCSRINGKGFFRKRDLVKHLRKVHEASNDSDAKPLDLQSSGPGQQSSVIVESVSGDPFGQGNSSNAVGTDSNNTDEVEAAMDVLRSKGYIVQKDPKSTTLSSN